MVGREGDREGGLGHNCIQLPARPATWIMYMHVHVGVHVPPFDVVWLVGKGPLYISTSTVPIINTTPKRDKGLRFQEFLVSHWTELFNLFFLPPPLVVLFGLLCYSCRANGRPWQRGEAI